MPYSKDIRCGEGWFNTNVNCFYDYLDGMSEELIVSDDFSKEEVQYHNTELEEKIEWLVNEYIRYQIFNEKREELDEDDTLPEEHDEDVWGYVYSHICSLVKRKPTWYQLRSTLTEEKAKEVTEEETEEEECEQDGYENDDDDFNLRGE